MVDVTAQQTKPALDAAAIREDFPILQHGACGKRLAYLDSAATSQKPQSVIDALTEYYTRSNANVHRSVHYLAERATTLYETARTRVARYVNAPATENVVWTRGTTEALNLVAASWGRRNVGAGDTILLTEMEHHSNLVPWQMLAKQVGAKLRFVPVTGDGRLDLDVALAELAKGPKLFGFTAKSNVLGTENPTAELCRVAREHGVVSVVDAAQAAPHGAFDVQALGCDFVAFSAHKMLGPMGIGALITRSERYAEMDPYHGGGEMILRVGLHESTYKEAPLKFEAGTPAAGDAIAFTAALDYLEALDLDAVHAHEAALTRRTLDALHDLGINTFGPANADERAGVVSFEVPGIHPHDVAQALDNAGVAVRAGHHCCQPLMQRLGVVATARASFYVYNTDEDVDALHAALAKLTSKSARAAVPEVVFDDLYHRDIISEHYGEPRGRDPIARTDASADGMNPICGDESEVALSLEGERISGLHVGGRGCSISVASGSILHDLVDGVTRAEARQTIAAVREVMHGGKMPSDLGDFEALEGVQKLPVRVKCALLPWTTFEQALGSLAEHPSPDKPEDVTLEDSTPEDVTPEVGPRDIPENSTVPQDAATGETT